MTIFRSAARPGAWRLTVLAGAAVAAAALAPGRPAAAPLAAPPAPAAAAGKIELASRIALSEGKSALMRLPFPAARLAVGDARIADVILLGPSEVYLLGKAAGSTNLILWNQANQASVVDIAVGVDTAALRLQLEQLFPGEKEIRISATGDTLVLSGVVADAARASHIAELAGAHLQGRMPAAAGAGAGLGATPAAAAAGAQQPGASKVINLLSIAAPQQVMLEVKIAEVSKSLVDQLGASFANATGGRWTASLVSNLLSGNPSVLGLSKNGNSAAIDAQKHDGLVKVLAEPTIMAISGQEASFLAGGKIFIPTAVSNNNGVPTITLTEKEFGVAVKFTPTVLEGGRINLRVAPEVSELNREGVGIAAAGVNATAILPSFTTRRASTTVQLFDGQSFAIGGLIKNNVSANIKALPVLGEIPVLGALFRSSDFQTDRSELVFIVTPHLVKPLAPEHALPTDAYNEPSRAEFFLQGKMEGAARPAAPAAGFEIR